MAEPNFGAGVPEALEHDEPRSIISGLRSNDSERFQNASAVNSHGPSGDHIDNTANTEASERPNTLEREAVSQVSDEAEAKPADDDPNDADTSEGERVSLLDEGWRSRYASFKKRAKMTPKRAKQVYQYASIMEERMTILEERYNEMANRLKMRIDDDSDDSDREEDKTKTDQPLLEFKLNHQLWQDFMSPPKDKSIIHIIDVLVEEPEYLGKDAFDPRRRTPLKMLQREESNNASLKSKERSQAGAAKLSRAIESLRGHRVPERIRFNSCALQNLLRKHFHSDAAMDKCFTNPGAITLRPFKALLYYEDEIRGLFKDLMEALGHMRSTGTSQETGTYVQNTDSNQANAATSGSQPDTDLPLVIDQETWSDVLKRLRLFHCDSCVQVFPSEWPTELAVEETFNCLFELIDCYLTPIVSRLRRREAEKVRFADLWHLFRSNDEIVNKSGSDTNNVMAMRVLRTNGGRRHIQPGAAPPFDSTPQASAEQKLQPVNGTNPFSIHAWHVDFDGTALVPVRRRFVIQPYAGERSVTDLEVYPIAYAKDAVKLKANLVERGKRFVKFVASASACYCDCRGEELRTKEELNDRVVVDMREYSRIGSLPNYSEPDALDMSETSDCYCILGPECYHRSVEIIHDQYTDKTAMKDHVAEQPIFQQLLGENQHGKLMQRDDDYAICTYRLFAYKLRSRDWVEVHVSSLKDATRTEDGKGFERLVLPAAQKDIIKSQVKEHFWKKSMHSTATQDDIDLVRGKGQGLIILLHGAPGVGKTCTAETVADLVHKPLYPVTCGDLGSTAKEIEDSLKQHFTLASRWDCVMLLDEADVFLAKRKSEDLHRNSVVSVFLRIMEYYKGLLFLTTNRVGTFDEAFKSRVHISLFYADFDQKTTIKVWKTFIRQTKEAIEQNEWTNFKVKSKEILQFAEDHWETNPKARWNGRQIRNAFHTAIAMAQFDARPEEDGEESKKIVLSQKQFAKIASTVRDFDKYMIETMGTTFEEKADKEKLRKLKLRDDPKKRDKGERRKDSKKSTKHRSNSSSGDSEISSDSEARGKKIKNAVKHAKNKSGEAESDSLSSDPE